MVRRVVRCADSMAPALTGGKDAARRSERARHAEVPEDRGAESEHSRVETETLEHMSWRIGPPTMEGAVFTLP